MRFSKTATPTFRDFFGLPRGLPGPFTTRQRLLTMNGRNAIYHALKVLDIPQGGTVLLPSFHCTALVDPVVRYGAKVKYYTVYRDLSLNLQEIDGLAQDNADAMLFIHYFGLPAPVTALRTIASNHNMKLIEDGTLTLSGAIQGQPIGTFGDAAVFSLRKLLPVPDGGVLLVDTKDASGLSKKLRAPWVYHIRMGKWLLDSMKPEARTPQQWRLQHPAASVPENGTTRDLQRGPDTHDDPEFVEHWADWPASLVSRWILRRTDFAAVQKVRVRNYRRFDQALSSVKGVCTFHTEGLDELCPLGYPFVYASDQRVDYRLRSRGVPAFSFGEHLHDTLPVSEFPDARFLSDHLTLLPVHQSLGEQDVDGMLSAVRDFLEEENAKEPYPSSPEVSHAPPSG